MAFEVAEEVFEAYRRLIENVFGERTDEQ